MIVVTGTKRSGTSLWMQILDAGGIPYIGDKFPKGWAEDITEDNPKGFYESKTLRNGVYFLTNPGKDGSYISPEAGKGKGIKLFIPGLVKTDIAYVEYVIATIRHWKTYELSIGKMYKKEEDWWREELNKKNPEKENKEELIQEELKRQRGSYPFAIEWFMENVQLLRNFEIRRFPLVMKSYEALLENPDDIISKVFSFIKLGDYKKGSLAVEKGLYRSKAIDNTSDYLEPKEVKLFDDLYYSIHQGSKVSGSLYRDLISLYLELEKKYPAEIYGGKPRRLK
jgi:hypothetical protein